MDSGGLDFLPRDPGLRARCPAAGNVSGAKAFNGVVGVDGAGAVVWAYYMDGAEAWDFLPRDAGAGVLLVGKADARTFEADRNGTLARWHANSELREVDFLGSLRRRSEVACTGRNRNYNQASHECRVDRRAGPARTTSTSPPAPGRCRRGGGRRPPGAGWDRASGALEPVYDMRWRWRRYAAAPTPLQRDARGAQAAIVAASGDLLVVDDGDSRPGCTTAVAPGDAGGGAALGRGDARASAGLARLSGRAPRLPSSIAPTSLGGKYDLAAKLLLPEPLANNGLQSAYRVVPWDRIHAESHDSPL
ncbi:hypothetical protein JL721_10850 [Aureococcus anophagefferens]|nr:hypothetical protein JL721_10850 [Aureococcus anophagefferens]